MRPGFAAVVLGFALQGAAKAAEPIATDRPDFVESSQVVGDGRLQIETSIAWERDEADGFATELMSTPTLLRFGVGEFWELRAETDGRVAWRERDGAQRIRGNGTADVSIGIKRHFAQAGPGGASMALLAHADLATGSRELRGEGVRPSLRLVAEWDLTDRVSLGLMPGVAREVDGDGRRYWAGIFGAVVGRAWSDRHRSFLEVAAARLAADAHGGHDVALNMGSALLLGNDAQLDVAASIALSDASPDRALTVGYSRRF